MFFVYNVCTRYGRRIEMAPICLYHHSNSNDMEHDLLWSDLTSDLRSNFALNFKVKLGSFDLSWREEHNDGRIDALDPIGQTLLTINICAKNGVLPR